MSCHERSMRAARERKRKVKKTSNTRKTGQDAEDDERRGRRGHRYLLLSRVLSSSWLSFSLPRLPTSSLSSQSSMHYRFQFRRYRLPFRAAVRTAHGAWHEREG